LGVAGRRTTLSVAKLRIAALIVRAAVTRVRRHRPPSVRALRLHPCHQRGNVAAGRFTLLALGHCVTCKTAHGTKYCNREEYLDHSPTSIAVRLV
jgi:hypothetical protein